MNSYGSVALVSQSIYKLLRYMNWFANDCNDDVDANHRMNHADSHPA